MHTDQNKNFWNKRTVLITGGAGFIGSWLSRALLLNSADITIVDIKPSLPRHKSPYGDLARAEYISGDVRDQHLIEELLGRKHIKTIFHLAAEAIVGETYKNPALAFDTNIRGTVTVLEAARLADKNIDIVIASSDKAYGNHDTLPYTEGFPLIGRNPYDCSKSCADLVAQSYAATYGSKVAITRCGNVYGGGDLNFSRLIPHTVRSLIRGKSPELRSDGNFQRDFVHVDDIVAGYIAVAEALGRNEHVGEAFNFGNNEPHRVIDVVKKICESINVSSEPKILAVAQFEIRDQYLDAKKAEEKLGWRPAVDLASGLEKTISWYKEENDYI